MIELFEKIVSRQKSLNIYEKKPCLMFVWVLNTAPMIQLSLKEKAAFHGLDVSLLRNMVKENIKKPFEIQSISCRRVFRTQSRKRLQPFITLAKHSTFDVRLGPKYVSVMTAFFEYILASNNYTFSEVTKPQCRKQQKQLTSASW